MFHPALFRFHFKRKTRRASLREKSRASPRSRVITLSEVKDLSTPSSSGLEELSLSGGLENGFAASAPAGVFISLLLQGQIKLIEKIISPVTFVMTLISELKDFSGFILHLFSALRKALLCPASGLANNDCIEYISFCKRHSDFTGSKHSLSHFLFI